MAMPRKDSQAGFLRSYCITYIRLWGFVLWYYISISPLLIQSFSQTFSTNTAISRNDPISLATEIYKVLDNSGSDWSFHVIFSGNYR